LRVALRRSLGGLVIVAALVAPAAAYAHNPTGPINASTSTNVPTIDGTVNAAEWADAQQYSLGFTGHPGTLWVKHTATTIYFAARISDAPGAITDLSLYFDNNHNGIKDPGEDGVISDPTDGDFFFSPTPAPGQHPRDTEDGGTNDVVAAKGFDLGAGQSMFEMSHPKNSADDAHDFSVANGQTVGLHLEYFTSGPSFFEYPAANFMDVGNFVDLVISNVDLQAPTVTVTNPPGGSDLSGVVNVTADASDNVGVDHVTFKYFDGTVGKFYTLGTDFAAPYAVSFDTTLFPDRPHNSSTIYAQSFDAAGNASTQTGVGVGINNGAPPRLGTLHGSLTNDFAFVLDFWPNTSVDFTVTPPSGGTPTGFTGTTDALGKLAVHSPIDLVPGVVLTATDGRGTKTLTLENIRIDDVDASTDVARGIAPGSRDVRVVVFDGTTEIANVTTPSSEIGTWSVHLPVDVKPGMHLLADVVEGGVSPDGDRSRADFDVPAAAATISLLANKATSEAGAKTVALDDIPASAINGAQAATSQTAPLDTIPLDTIPLDTIDPATSPLDTIPLDTIGLSATALLQNALGGEPLTHVPLRPPLTWESKLLGTPLANLPIVSITLADVAQQAPAVMHSITLGDINLALSPLDTIPLAGAALGKTPLDTIPVQGHTGAQNQADWCALIHAIPGFAGYDCSTIPATTAMGLTLQGVPLDTIPLDTIPLDTIDLSKSPLDTIPLDTIPLQTLQNSPLDTIPLDTIDFTKSVLAAIPLDTIPTPNAVVQCATFTCPGHTLGQAAAANKLQPGATFGDIAKYPGVTLGNLGHGMPPNVTLRYLFALLFGEASYDWEALPLDFPVQDFSSDGPKVSYTATFQVGGAATSATVTVTLTNGERYVPGSTTIGTSGGGGIGIQLAAATTEPTVTESEGVETVKWTVTGLTAAVDNQLHFDARPGTTLGTDTAKAAINAAGATASSATVPLTVTDTFEGNGTSDAAKPLASGSFAFSYVTSAGDKDFWTTGSGPVGTQTQIFLSHIPKNADYDLIVYGAPQPALRSAPLDTIPLDTIPAGDVPPDVQQRSQNVPPESIGDIAVDPPPGMVVLGTSDVRGNGNEQVDIVSTGNGPLIVEVVSTTGEFSDDPYVLRMAQDPTPSLPPCQARSMGSGGTARPMPTVPANVNTLFLINAKQFGDLNGAQAETDVMNALTALSGRSDLGVIGSVIPVESDSATANAYTAWNADPCSPEKANNVVRPIGELLDNLMSTRDVKNIVLVGGDDVVPMGRITNPTPLADEAGYASAFGFGSNNELVSAFANRYLLSDDVYGDPGPQQFLGGQLYVPDVAVGRLIDKPSEILAQITAFTANNGIVNPKTEFSSGYGFLTDGTQATAANFKAAGRTGTDLINETWTSGDLDARVFPSAGQQPKLMALNAHYDHNRLLPADQNAANLQTNLYTTDKLTSHGAGSANGVIVTTVGCHSGVNVPDSLGLGAALSRDWPQAWTQTGAFAFNGNTGYGLGDTVAVAYSERLQANLAKNMDGSMTVGQALAFAKQDYLGGLNAITNYDVKVINESTLFGLPMWKLGTGSLPPAPQSLPTFTDPSGLQAAAVSVSPTFTPVTTPGYGTYFTVNGQAEFVNRRPIEPSTTVDVTQEDLVAHGFLITSLASQDSSIDAAWSRIVTNSANQEPELVGLTIFPTQLQNIRTVTTPIGQRQRLVLALGQFRDDGVPDPAGAGTQRLFTQVGGRVVYALPSVRDFISPKIGPITISKVGSTVAFAATAADKTETGGVGTVKRFVVVYLDGTVWRTIDMALTNGVWSGAGPLSGNTTTLFGEAMDAAGNVAVTHLKGTVQNAVPPPPHGAVTATVTGPSTNGWFTGAAQVTLSGGATGVGIEFSLDLGGFHAYSSAVTVTGDGTHRFDYRATDGSAGTVFVPIDTTGPKITTGDRHYILKSTGNTFDVVCSDAGSGVASCTTTPAAPDTSSIGQKQFTVNAADRVGNTATATGVYHVDYGFKGFFPPISNQPFVNEVKAGNGVPVKFSLSGNQGLNIFASGYPKSQKISCDSSAPVDDTIPTVTAGSSTLTYDAASDQYTYTWKTDNSWAGTCRQLIVGFVDGTTQRADFRLK
jgi:Bacterial Ig domain/Peptidase family C25